MGGKRPGINPGSETFITRLRLNNSQKNKHHVRQSSRSATPLPISHLNVNITAKNQWKIPCFLAVSVFWIFCFLCHIQDDSHASTHRQLPSTDGDTIPSTDGGTRRPST